jgi:hypothetical protein
MQTPRRAFEFGDVVGVKEFGNRCAVIVSATQHNKTAEDVVIMLITTQERHSMRGGAIVLERWKEYGLHEPSVVKPVLSSKGPDELVLYGAVDDEIKARLRQSLATIFGGTVKKSSSTAPAPPSVPPRSAPQK